MLAAHLSKAASWRKMFVRGTSVSELKILISREQIAARVAELAEQITGDFHGEPVLFVGVLKGAAIFLGDLVRQVLALHGHSSEALLAKIAENGFTLEEGNEQ